MRRYHRKYTPKEKITLIKVPSTAVSKLTHIATHSDHGSHTRDFGGWVPYFYSFTRQSRFAFSQKMVKNVKFSSFSSLLKSTSSLFYRFNQNKLVHNKLQILLLYGFRAILLLPETTRYAAAVWTEWGNRYQRERQGWPLFVSICQS